MESVGTLNERTGLAMQRNVVASLIGLLGLCVVGCGDPAGPGVSGSVSLGTSIKPDGFQSLVVRAVPDAGFDPAKPVFDVPPPAGEKAWAADTASLAGLTFPHSYHLGDDLGVTEQQTWRVFAWLSATAETTDLGPKSAEPFGTTTFSLGSCQQYGGYCQTKEGVNVTIDTVAP